MACRSCSRLAASEKTDGRESLGSARFRPRSWPTSLSPMTMISQGASTRLRAPKLRGNPPSNRLQLLSPVLGFAPARHGTAPPPRQAEQRAKPGCSTKLQDFVREFDSYSLLLVRDRQAQLIYKHAVSTIMPGEPVRMPQTSDDQGALQDLGSRPE